MKINLKLLKDLLVFSLLFLTISCGSGSTTVDKTNPNPLVNADTGNVKINIANLTLELAKSSIDMKGYNACYDVNENGSCDSDEPTASLDNSDSSLDSSAMGTAQLILSSSTNAATQITYFSEFVGVYSPVNHLGYSVSKELGISSSELRQILAKKLGYTSYSQVPEKTIESLNHMLDQVLRVKSHISNTRINLYNNNQIVANSIKNRGKLSVILAPSLYEKIDEFSSLNDIVATYNNLGSALNLDAISDAAKILEAQKGYLLEVFGNQLQGVVDQVSIIDKKPGKITIGALPATTSNTVLSSLSWEVSGNKMNYWKVENNGKLIESKSIVPTTTDSASNVSLDLGVNKITIFACYKEGVKKTCSAKKIVVQKVAANNNAMFNDSLLNSKSLTNNSKAVGDSCAVSTASGVPAKPTIDAWRLDSSTTANNPLVKWNMWWGINGTSWNLCANDKVVYTASLTANPNNGNQKGEYQKDILSSGNNKLTVQLCNDKGCSTSESVYIVYTDTTTPNPDPMPTPGSGSTVCNASTAMGIPNKPYLVKSSIENSRHTNDETIAWNMWWGTNGNSWNLCVNDKSITSISLVENGNSAQKGSYQGAFLSSGVNFVKVSLCNYFGCAVSDEVVINYSANNDDSGSDGSNPMPPPPAPPVDIDDPIVPGMGDDGIGGGGGNDDGTPPIIGGGNEQNQTIHKPIFYHTYTVIPLSTTKLNLSWYAIAGKNAEVAYLYREGQKVSEPLDLTPGVFGNSQTGTFSDVDVPTNIDSYSFYIELCDYSRDATGNKINDSNNKPIEVNCTRSETYTLLREVTVVTPPETLPPSTSTGNLKDCQEARIGQNVSSACLTALRADNNFGGTYDSTIGSDYKKVAAGKHIIGYFVEWGVYSRNYHADDIPANYLTHIYYAFLKPSASGEVSIDDFYAALDKRYSDTDSWSSSSPDAGSLKRLWLLKQKFPHLQLCFSVGGWTYSDHFYDIAADSEKRKRFAQSSKEIAQKYGFDCIDVDWEFPIIGGEESDGLPRDEANFTLFMKELYDTLNPAGIEITAAVSANDKGIAGLNYVEAEPYMDFISLMTYDFNGAWNKFTGHQSSIFANDYPSSSLMVGYNPKWNIDGALQGLKKQISTKSSKIAIGLAFYGRTWSGVTANPPETRPIVSATGGGVGSLEKGVVDYKDMRNTGVNLQTGNKFDTPSGSKVPGNWEYTWDDEAKAASLYSSGNQNYITYSDPKTIYLQSCYAKHNAGGLIIWELSGDWTNNNPNNGGELLKEVRRALKGEVFSLDGSVNCTNSPIKGESAFTPPSGGGTGGSTSGGNDNSDDGSNLVFTNTSNGTSDTTLGSIISEAQFKKMFPNRNGRICRDANFTGFIGLNGLTNDTCSTRESGIFTYANLLKAAEYFPDFANKVNSSYTTDQATKVKLIEVAAFLANTAHETTGGWGSYDVGTSTRYKFGYFYDQEVCGASGNCGHKYCQASNSNYGSLCDGQRSFHGRGPIQLSWNYNYGLMAEAINYPDLKTNPDVVLTVPGLAYRTALWFWMTAQSPKPSSHNVMTGQWIPTVSDKSKGRANVSGTAADVLQKQTGFGMTANIINGGLECGFESSKVKNRIGHFKTFLLILQDKDPYTMSQADINKDDLIKLVDSNTFTKCKAMMSY